MILNLPKNTNIFYLPWIDDITIVKKTKKKYDLNKELLNFSEFELVLGRNSLFKITNISELDEYMIEKLINWKSYNKYKKKSNKTLIYHMEFMGYDNIDIPNFENIIKNIDKDKLLEKYIHNLYIIPK